MDTIAVILLALSMIESGDNDLSVGAKGERSRYQITEYMWVSNCGGQPFDELSKNKAQAEIVARTILEKLNREFQAKKNVKPTNSDLYFMWRLGFNRYVVEKVEPNQYLKEDCARFNNLVEAFKQK